MADSSRNILLALLVVGVALAIFYMMDPTMGGLLGKHEGFQDTMGPSMMPSMDMAAPQPAPQEILPPNNPPSVTGMHVEKFQDSRPAVAQNNAALANLMSVTDKLKKQLEMAGNKESYANHKKTESYMDYKKKETFMGANGDMAHSPSATTEGFQNPASAPSAPANCYPKNQLAPQELLPTDPNSKWAEVNPTGAGDIGGKNFLGAGALIGVNTVGQSLRNANQQLRSEPPCPQAQVSIWNQSTIEPDLQRRPLEGY